MFWKFAGCSPCYCVAFSVFNGAFKLIPSSYVSTAYLWISAHSRPGESPPPGGNDYSTTTGICTNFQTYYFPMITVLSIYILIRHLLFLLWLLLLRPCTRTENAYFLYKIILKFLICQAPSDGSFFLFRRLIIIFVGSIKKSEGRERKEIPPCYFAGPHYC